ncbi:uncharacterized protein [Macrobrachium rosenbergii]|uniref:uncharacterized protein n=1 Tax=Macrobrachium rosenbergii TaxID=79674 RepID=UPI0034D587AE
MVKRVNSSLKAVLMACCTDERWKEQLPCALLGVRTAPKANGDTSPAEKVYGETLAVPREFFLLSADGTDIPLPRTITYSPPALHFWAYVFVRVDAHLLPLTRPYRGSHRVIRWASKALLLDIHRREDWITINRLKPTFLLDSKVCEEVGRRPRVPLQFLPGAAQKTHPAVPRCQLHPTPTVLQKQGPTLTP